MKLEVWWYTHRCLVMLLSRINGKQAIGSINALPHLYGVIRWNDI